MISLNSILWDNENIIPSPTQNDADVTMSTTCMTMCCTMGSPCNNGSMACFAGGCNCEGIPIGPPH